MYKGLTALFLLILVFGCAAAGHAQKSGDGEGTKTPSSRTYEGVGDRALVWGGCTGQFTLGITGAGIGAYIEDLVSADDKEGYYIIGAVAGYMVGDILGTAIGVYIVGTSGNETGSFLATLGGSALGAVVGLCCGYAVWALPPVSVAAIVIGPVSGAIWGFDRTRRARTSTEKLAMVNISDGQISLAVPGLCFRPDPHGRGGYSHSVHLLRVSL